jgi:hypothetical protein
MKKRDYLLLGVLAFFSILTIWAVLSIKSEGAKCIANPYKYSALQLEMSNNAPVTCQCSIFKGDGGTLFFDKDNENISANRIERIYNDSKVDWGNVLTNTKEVQE